MNAPVAITPEVLEKYPLAPGTRAFLQGRLGHFVDGEDRDSSSGQTMVVYDPSSGAAFARVAAGDATDVDRAAQAARNAFADGRWRDVPPHEKERILRRLAQLIQDNRAVFKDLDALEGGVTGQHSEFSIQYATDITNYYAGWPTKIQGGMPPARSELVVMEVREPIGVCGVIFPWNGPSCVPLGILPPLACGNSVVFKPAEQTPLAALFFARLCQEAGIPDGVVNVVQGFGATAGAAVVAHPQIDSISFTGSVETGRIIQAGAATTLKRVSLELGGKSPQIIFGDADLDRAVTTAAGSVFGHSGQICVAGSRIMVERHIYDEVVDRLKDAAQALRVGSAFDGSTTMGPLISQQQLDRVSRYVGVGKADGAQLVAGGERVDSCGYFHQPTIFADVTNDMKIAREEIFGPIASVIPFDDDEQAIAIANDSDYALAAGVWTRDLGRAHRAMRSIRTGTVWVNTYLQCDACVSYGGLKISGHGRALGLASIEEFTQVRSFWIDVT